MKLNNLECNLEENNTSLIEPIYPINENSIEIESCYVNEIAYLETNLMNQEQLDIDKVYEGNDDCSDMDKLFENAIEYKNEGTKDSKLDETPCISYEETIIYNETKETAIENEESISVSEKYEENKSINLNNDLNEDNCDDTLNTGHNIAIELLEDKELFIKNKPGVFIYEQNEWGKSAQGQLTDEMGKRDLNAQKKLENKPKGYDAGHLIARINGGDGFGDNLEIQEQNFNRSMMKRFDKKLNEKLKSGKKVYEYIESYRGHINFPSAFMGFTIIEDVTGKRDLDYFSFTNVSRKELEEWDEIEDSSIEYYDMCENLIDYDPKDFENELNEDY